MKPFRSAVAALALFVSAPALAQARTAEESQQIDALVTTTLADTGVPSASVAIVRGGKIVFTRAWGKQSPDIAPASPDVPYQLASISTQFTATALMMHVDQGQLTLDSARPLTVHGITYGDSIKNQQHISTTTTVPTYTT